MARLVALTRCLLNAPFLLVSQLASLQATVVTLDNGVIKVGIDTTYGGAITYLSQSGSTTNLINDNDHGRQVQQSYYSGPDNFHPLGTIQDPNYNPFPWNPVQAGDAFGNPSELLASSNVNGVIYIKTRPKQWSLQNYPSDCIIEQWILLDGPAVRVHCKLTNQRSDHTQYPPYGQELPAVYGIGTLCHLFSYTGLAPFTGDALTEQPAVWPFFNWRATENWGALVNSNNFGVGIHHPDAIDMVGAYYAPTSNPCTGESPDNNTAYLGPHHLEVLDYNIVYQYDFNLIVGTLTDIRNWVYTHHSDPRPDYSFRTSRSHWYANYGDAGPPRGFLRQYLNGPDPTLTGPFCAFPASTCPTIYFAARYVMSSPPAHAFAQLFWDTNNLGCCDDFSETRSEIVPVIPDGKWRIYSFNVGANPAWSGLISQLRFDPIQSGGPGDYVDIAGISYLNEFPIVTKLSNISTRGLVQTGDNVLIGGLIISGNGPKQVILRALGPTLGQPPFNVPNALANPTLSLFDGTGNLVTSNDDWGNAPNKQAIIDGGFAPPSSLESAVLQPKFR